ncbi:MAG: methyltransferase domain-containing protein [Steroidobacteraceae bacterium]
MKTNPYTATFYRTYIEESRGSARRLLPHVLRMFAPGSVVDIGCGVGTWLSVFRELGVPRTLGIDGPYVDASQLMIDHEMFRSHNLSTALRLDEKFDLAVSLEVAEHIPVENAQTFVDTLTALAPLLLFSAAIPFQGGDNHVNEQWPEYWIERFAERNYVAYDCIRPLVWDDPSVAYYYAQNAFIYVHRDRIPYYPALSSLQPAAGPLSRVHPRRWIEANDPRRQPLRPVLRALPHSLSKAVAMRIRRSLSMT